MNRNKYNRTLDDFERNHPDILGHVIDWYSNGRNEIVAVLDDCTRVIYNELDGTARYLHSVKNEDCLTEEEWRKLFHIRLESMLRDRRMTQGELSEKSGVSRIMINSYINGRSLPSIYNLARIANALNVDVSELTSIN